LLLTLLSCEKPKKKVKGEEGGEGGSLSYFPDRSKGEKEEGERVLQRRRSHYSFIFLPLKKEKKKKDEFQQGEGKVRPLFLDHRREHRKENKKNVEKKGQTPSSPHPSSHEKKKKKRGKKKDEVIKGGRRSLHLPLLSCPAETERKKMSWGMEGEGAGGLHSF